MRLRLLAVLLSLILAPPAWAEFTLYNENFVSGPTRIFARDIEILLNAIAGNGVTSGGALSEQATPDMTVAVAKGTAWTTMASGTFVRWADTNLTVAAAETTSFLTRYDLISVPLNSLTPTPVITTGVADYVPEPPAIPVTGGIPNVVLAILVVPANTTAITNGLIVDKRISLGSRRFSGSDDGTELVMRASNGIAPQITMTTQGGTYTDPTTSDTSAPMASFLFGWWSGSSFVYDSSILAERTPANNRLVLTSPEMRYVGRQNSVDNPVAVEIANAGTTGTTLNKIAKLTGAPSTAVIAGTGDTTGVLGIVVAGAGTTGNAQIARGGIASCVFDGATTAGNYVVASTTVAGDCHDFGATAPTTGIDILGRVLTTNASGGTYTLVVQPTMSEFGCPTCVTAAAALTSGNLMKGGGSQASATTKVAITEPTTAGTLVFGTDNATVTLQGTDTYVGRATTDTLTNKTLNADSTGNVVTLPFKKWLPAAGCVNATAGSVWDLPTSTPAVATCVTGTNIQKGVLAFADTTGGFSAQITEMLPADWTTTGGLDISLYWTTTATSGNAKWTVQFVCTDVAASATDDPAFPTTGNGFNTVTTAAPGSASQVQTSTITGATLPTSCVTATAELLHIRVFRDGNDAADTIAATANLIGAKLTYRRSM